MNIYEKHKTNDFLSGAFEALQIAIYRMAQKSKPLPNDQKIVFVKLKYQSRTMTLFVGISYSMRDLLSDLNNYV